jgi:3-hydroxyisobutyrate dehydrogenase
MKIGFIGLGTMGAGMAANLVRTEHDVVVHDLDRERARPLEEIGATWADEPADLAVAVDVLFTSLPGPPEMTALAEVLLPVMRPGSAWFDLTTNSPTTVREVHRTAGKYGIELLDAPVSGGPAGARSGRLAVYLGGDREIYERHAALLDAIGDRIMYVGEIGAGSVAKLMHNCVSLSVRQAIAEVLTLGVKAGVDIGALYHGLRQGAAGRSRTFDVVSQRYLQQVFDPPSFALVLANKDLTLALELADQFEVPMRCAEAVRADFEEALARDWGHLDSQTPLLLQNERAGVDIKLSADDVTALLDRG